MPKQRFYAAMIDREDPTATPKWWGFGKTIYQKLLEELLGDDYGGFLDPYTGNDAEVSLAAKTTGVTYASTNFKFKKNSTKLADDTKRVEEILNAVTPISEVFKPLNAAEISEKLATWLQLSQDDGAEAVKGGSKAAAEDGEKSSSGMSLDDAFDQAMKDE
jgi:hypothetical protein